MTNKTIIIVDWTNGEICIRPVFNPRINITIRVLDIVIKGELPMAFTLPVDRVCTAEVSAVDKFGNPAEFDGLPSWSVVDETVLSIAADDAGIVTVSPLGPLTTTQLRVDIDADLGEGVKTITGLLDIETVAGEAVTATITPTLE